jgi:hypothetical protein
MQERLGSWNQGCTPGGKNPKKVRVFPRLTRKSSGLRRIVGIPQHHEVLKFNFVPHRTLPPGVEYLIHDAQEPHLFVVRKQMRHSPKSVTHLTFYYILDGRIYQAPALHTTILSRMVPPPLPPPAPPPPSPIHSFQSPFLQTSIPCSPKQTRIFHVPA